MSKLWTLLQATSVALDAHQSIKLHQMQKQGADAAEMQKLIQALQNEVFMFQEMAKEILLQAEEFPKAAAGAMAFLAQRYENLGLSPQMFSDLQYKKLAADTTRLLRDGNAHLRAALSFDDQTKLDKMVMLTPQLEDMKQYLAWQPLVEAYRQALPLYQRVSKETSKYDLLLVGSIFSVFFIPIILLSITQSIFVIAIGFFAGLMLVAAIVYLRINAQGGNTASYRQAKEAIIRCRQHVNREKYESLEARLGRSYHAVVEDKQEIEQLLIYFFGGTPFVELMGLELPRAAPAYLSKQPIPYSANDRPASLSAGKTVLTQPQQEKIVASQSEASVPVNRSPADNQIPITATYCPQCKSQIPPTAKFCAYCGEKLN